MRMWAWLPVFDPAQAHQCWGTTSEAMEEMLTTAGRVDLEQIAGLEMFWHWHPLEEQTDTADLIHSLWTVSQGQWLSGKIWSITSYGAVEQKERVPMDIRFPLEEGRATLERLVHIWCDEDHGNHFHTGQNALVIQIGRSYKEEGQWHKHHLPLDIEMNLTLPVSSDGIHVYKEGYRVAGMILHLGKDQGSGHFVTVQCYHEIMWLIDDDAAPEPIEQLTEEQKSQIFQVWLIRDQVQKPAPVLSPVSLVEEERQPPAKKQRTESRMQVDYCNVTNYGKQVEKWAMTLQRPTFLAETHLGVETLNAKVQFLNTRGKRTLAMPAQPTGNGGTHGGLMLVYDRDDMIHKVADFSENGHGWLAAQWAFQDWSIIIVGVYMKSGENIQGHTNAKVWASLIAFLRNLQVPYVVLGDFNEDPDEVQKTKILDKAEGIILRTGKETTLQGSEIDWGFISKNYAPIATMESDWDVPCRPHCRLHVSLDAGFDKIKVRQLIKYPPIQKMTAMQWPWSAFVGQDTQLDIMGQEMKEEDRAYAKWASKAEAFVLQNLEEAKTGRGVVVQVEQKELTKHGQPWMWKRGAMAFWGQLQAILNHSRVLGYLLPKQVKQIQTYVMLMDKHWQDEQGLREMQDKLWTLTGHWDDQMAAQLERQANQQEQKAKEQVLDEETQQYREWLVKGYTKGFKALFKCLKRSEEPYQRPFQEVPYIERMQKRWQQWDQIWHIRDEPIHIPNAEEIEQRGFQAAKELPEIKLEHAMRIIRRLGQKAAGPDGISNDLLKALPWEGVKELIYMMREVELTGKAPKQWITSMVTMIPKNSSIERPIALVSVIHRLWCRLRKDLIDTWQAGLTTTMPWERAIPGNQCLTIAISRLLRTETFQANQKSVISVLCDLSTFYDRIDLVKLCQRWEATQFPAVQSMMATKLYTGMRMMEAEGEISHPYYTERGILAGDPLAPQIAKVYLSEEVC